MINVEDLKIGDFLENERANELFIILKIIKQNEIKCRFIAFYIKTIFGENKIEEGLMLHQNKSFFKKLNK